MTSTQFVSWSRRGAGAGQPAGPPQGPDLGSPTRRWVRPATVIARALPAKGNPAESLVTSAPMQLLGPADAGRPAQIVRCAPRDGDRQAEPNYLALVEFAHPDLPWMFSPDQHTTPPPGGVRPWLRLLVLEVPPGTAPADRLARSPRGPYPVLTDPGPWPEEQRKELWAWAHVQVQTDSPEAADAMLRTPSPEWSLVRSRVLCPTRLAPDRAYLACLVPTFEAGRLAGLGLPADTGGMSLTHDGAPLPVYHSWSFHTGPAGDFETLARKLNPLPAALAATIGVRQVHVGLRASRLAEDDTGFTPAPYPVATAITRLEHPAAPPAPDGQPAPPDLPASGLEPGAADPQVAVLHRRLKLLLDPVAAREDDDVPLVGPPLYGRWHAEVNSLDGTPGAAELAAVEAGTSQTWITQLNADPAMRAAAGLGTRIVQQDQEELMRAAWEQLADILAANRRIRWAHLFARTGGALHARLGALSTGSALRVAGPALARLVTETEAAAAGRETVYAGLAASTLPPSVADVAFTRGTRYAVKAASRDARSEQPGVEPGLPLTAATCAQRAVAGLSDGDPGMLPARFTGPRAVQPEVLAELLSDPRLARGVTDRFGAAPDQRLAQIAGLPATLGAYAAQVDEQPAAAGAGAQVRFAAGSETAQQVHALITAAGTLERQGRIQLGLEMRHDFGTFTPSPGQAAELSIDAFQRLAAVARQDDDGHLPASPALTAAGLRILVPARPAGPLGALTRDASVGDQPALVLATAMTLRDIATDALGPVSGAPATTGSRLLAQLLTGTTDADSHLLAAAVPAFGTEITSQDATAVGPALTRFSPALADQAVRALTPDPAYQRLLDYAHEFVGPQVRRRRDSPFHPAMAAPRFPAPIIDRLSRLDRREWVLGGVNQMPANSVALLAPNWRFIEALAVGLNHELARELLWRGYPTDRRGSSFPRFWPGDAPDLADLDGWAGDLGDHAPPGRAAAMTILVIKGDLLRRYPTTIIGAVRGRPGHAGGLTSFTPDAGAGAYAEQLFPARPLGDDVSYTALRIDPWELRLEDPEDYQHRWYVSLRQPDDEPRFGLDEKPGAGPGTNAGRDRDDWSWQGRDQDTPTLRPADLGAATSAAVAANCLQRPFLALLRAPDFLP
ncbi:hypothetical protein [Frankia sp. Cj5]|uniref:hypothetical protein n=1 Tax=Frankia sp. Cj5 TaxID=2880978 RepID=UPI001EF666BE|nr:hypothetical protein [Frankia sp. Cj5]